MADKTVLVTGATSGLGIATAQALAAMGATVIIGAHTLERGEDVRRRVAAASGSEHVHVVAADLSSQAAVRSMASEVIDRFDRLDVLINNAGVDVGKRTVTDQLLGLLRASTPARVLNVVSSGYKGGKIEFDDLQSERRFSGQRAYNNSKLALVIFTYELARRLADSGVTVNAVDPGFVRGTRIGLTLPAGYKALGTLMWPFMATVDKGIETAVWAASDPSLTTTTGRYFKRRRQISTSSATSDEQLAQRLWDASEQLVASQRR
jgi:NAD(P)-dependent dehydrogenase (short-subunit alcohol dehydrogenase family)